MPKKFFYFFFFDRDGEEVWKKFPILLHKCFMCGIIEEMIDRITV